MTWTDIALDKAKAIIAQESELLARAYSKNYGEQVVKSGLYFSFGDITHFVHSSVRLSLSIRKFGGAAGIACFEDLIKRLRLYLIAELKLVIENKPPYDQWPSRHNGESDYNFILEFLDLFKELDQLEIWLKEIREKEGGNYQ
jgi:hypothetical protein